MRRQAVRAQIENTAGRYVGKLLNYLSQECTAAMAVFDVPCVICVI